MLMRRLAFACLSLALVALVGVAQAQSLSQQKLQWMIAEALKDPETVTFARPEPLGFTEKVVTHQVSYEQRGIAFTLAVTKPRLRDGLIFFSHDPSRKMFVMHRTDTHLRRVASARNDLTHGNAGLSRWDGPSADDDFATQLAFWAAMKQ